MLIGAACRGGARCHVLRDWERENVDEVERALVVRAFFVGVEALFEPECECDWVLECGADDALDDVEGGRRGDMLDGPCLPSPSVLWSRVSPFSGTCRAS